MYSTSLLLNKCAYLGRKLFPQQSKKKKKKNCWTCKTKTVWSKFNQTQKKKSNTSIDIFFFNRNKYWKFATIDHFSTVFILVYPFFLIHSNQLEKNNDNKLVTERHDEKNVLFSMFSLDVWFSFFSNVTKGKKTLFVTYIKRLKILHQRVNIGQTAQPDPSKRSFGPWKFC